MDYSTCICTWHVLTRIEMLIAIWKGWRKWLSSLKTYVCRYVCMDIHMYVFMFVCICVCMHACICMYAHVCITIACFKYVQSLYMYVCIHVCMHTCIETLYPGMGMQVYYFKHKDTKGTYIYTSTHIHTLNTYTKGTYIHTSTHTCVHTYTSTCKVLQGTSSAPQVIVYSVILSHVRPKLAVTRLEVPL